MRPTACGPIECQQAGQGTPMLMIHGSAGGHDQAVRAEILRLVTPRCTCTHPSATEFTAPGRA
jgi:hypothetical protein